MPWQPERPIEIVAGTPPGGGLDRTARALKAALEGECVLDVPVTVRNVAGDGARKAWAYLDGRRGDPHVLSVSHPNLTSDRLVGLASFDHRSYTPVAMLYTEYIAFAVRADSALRAPADLLRRLRVDAASLSVALSTALGNPNHLALAKLSRHVGGDPRAPRVFDSALDAIADVLEGAAEVAAVTAASTLERNALRVLAVSAPKRLAGALAPVPTWIEQSVDCTVGAWRGISGAHGIAESQVAFWTDALRRAVAGDVWRSELDRQGWTGCFLAGEALTRELDRERIETAEALSELGMLRI